MLKVSNLTKAYKGVNAVEDFTVHIEKGHIYGIVGPNGAGKTTFFKMLAGLAKPTSGEIIVTNGETLKSYRDKMSFMIETPYLYDGMTAFENIKIIGGIKGEDNEDNMRKLLELVKLHNTGKKKVRQFSLGMKQRLGIACALTSNPEILVLDEPMNGVDPEGIVELREILWNLCEEKKITLLISSHILGELFQLSTDFIFIKTGRIVNMIDKKTLEEKNSGVIEVGTTDNNKAYEVLKQAYGADKVSMGNGCLNLTDCIGKESEVSKLMMQEGLGITKFNVVTLNLEQYYMKEIVGNGNSQTI